MGKSFFYFFRETFPARRRIAVHVHGRRYAAFPQLFYRFKKNIRFFHRVQAAEKKDGILSRRRARLEQRGVDADGHPDGIRIARDIRLRRGVADLVREKSRDARPRGALLVVAPEHEPLSAEPPESSAKKRVLLVHVHEHGVMFPPQGKNVVIKMKNIFNA